MIYKIVLILLLHCVLVLGFDKYINELIKINQGGYEKLEKSKNDDNHEIIFCIKQKNREYIEKLIYEVSSPRSPKYGKHLSRQEVADLTTDIVATNAVIDYLKSKNIEYFVTTYGEYIKATATIETWENILQTKFDKYYNDDGNFIHRSSNREVTIPSELSNHVQHILKINDFPLQNYNKVLNHRKSQTKNSKSQMNTVNSNYPECKGFVDIACLQEFYAINPTDINQFGNSTVRQAVYESLNQTFSMADLTTFQQQHQVSVNPVNEVYCNGTISYNGNPAPCAYTGVCHDEDNCGEANLDVQYIMGIAQNISTIVWYSNGDWDDFIISLANAPNPPNVISISYGGPESSVTSNQKYTFDYEAIKLGLIGTSVIVSSGDDGVAGNQARVSSIFCGYNPQFPASSPWVTAVGATQGPESGGEEVGIYFLILI